MPLEYIGQLEGEVAAKVDEANALRTENRQLREENNRLTDLTRMLLGSPAFTGFLQELNQSGLSETSRQQPRQERTQPQPQPTRKDINPREAARQLNSQQPQVGMAFIPEQKVDLSLFDTPSWNPSIPSTDYHVFAVTDVPQGPILDLERCTGKTKKPTVLSTETTKMVPSLPEFPKQVKEASSVGAVTPKEHVVKPKPGSSATSPPLAPVLNSKSTFEPSTAKRDVSEPGSWERLMDLCSELDVTANRLADIVPGME